MQKECVTDIVKFKGLSTNEETSCVELLGYHIPGDGGGGTFYWDSSAAEDDNAGTVIKPNIIQSSQPGRWRRVFEGAASVRWFGAVGNGLQTTPMLSRPLRM